MPALFSYRGGIYGPSCPRRRVRAEAINPVPPSRKAHVNAQMVGGTHGGASSVANRKGLRCYRPDEQHDTERELEPVLHRCHTSK